MAMSVHQDRSLTDASVVLRCSSRLIQNARLQACMAASPVRIWGPSQGLRPSHGSTTSGMVSLGRASQCTQFRWRRQSEASAGPACGRTSKHDQPSPAEHLLGRNCASCHAAQLLDGTEFLDRRLHLHCVLYITEQALRVPG